MTARKNLKIAKLVSAFFLAPLIGIVSYQLIIVSYAIWPFSTNPTRLINELTFGISPLLVVYPALVVVGAPVFILIRYLFGRRLWSCIFSAIGTVVIVWSWLFLGIQFDNLAYLSFGRFISSVSIGIFAYGLTFWMLTNRKMK